MKKKYILYFVIFFTIFFVYDSVFALTTNKKTANFWKDRDKLPTNNCKIKASQATTLVRIDYGSVWTEHHGYLYEHTDGGVNYFCVNPEYGDAGIFDMDAKLGEKDYNAGGIVYTVYQQLLLKKVFYWYLDNSMSKKIRDENASMYAQAAIWYVSALPDKNQNYFKTEGLVSALKSMLYTKLCYEFESSLKTGKYSNARNQVNIFDSSNQNFSCDCFLTPTSESGDHGINCGERYTSKYKNYDWNDATTVYKLCGKPNANRNNCDTSKSQLYPGNTYKTANGKIRYLTLETYLEKIEPAIKAYAEINGVYQEYIDNIPLFVDEIRYHVYEGDNYPDVYFYKPKKTGKYQFLIGLQGCKSGSSGCKTEVANLKTKYSETDRKNRNSSYMTELSKLQIKYSSLIPYERLSVQEFIENPVCMTCETDVGLYNAIYSNNPSRAHDFYLKMLQNWGTELKGTEGLGTLSCSDDSTCESNLLQFLKYKAENNTDQANAYYMVLLADPKFNKSYNNPSCSDEPIVCLPKISLMDCDFYGVITAFEMEDTDIDACWKEKNISYQTETDKKTSKWEEVSNEYCSIYCREELSSQFPGAQKNIKAGQGFFWGINQSEGLFGYITAKRQCYTRDIAYANWQNDFVKNEIEILETYNYLQAQILFNDSSNVPYSNGKCDIQHTEVCEKTTTPASCSSECGANDCAPNCGLVPDGKGGWESTCGTCTKFGNKLCCGTITDASSDNCGQCSSYTHKNGSCYDENGVTCKRDGKSFTSGGNTGKVDDKSDCFAPNTDCSKITTLVEDESGTRKKLLDLLNNRKSLITKIRNCQSNEAINSDSIYTFNTILTVTYTDPATGVNNRYISGDTEFERKNVVRNFNMTEGTYQGDLTVDCANLEGFLVGDKILHRFTTDKYRCDDNYKFTIKKLEDYTWDFDGQWNYSYNKEIFTWKFIKENGFAYNKKTYEERYGEFYATDGTYGFMTAYSLVTGFYEFANVHVKNFGNNGHFDDLLKENNEGSDEYTYYCEFHIENEMYGSECHFDCNFVTKECKITTDSPEYCNRVSGIDVVYRVIELNKDTTISFPGIVGTGRYQGANWATFIAYRNEKFKNIMNYDNIYYKEPIYSIDLTPGLMQEIRQDNVTYRQKNLDPYTSMRYTDNTYKIICDGSDPKDQTCASKWLSKYSAKGILKGIYGSIKDTDERLARIRTDKNSDTASGGKVVAGGA